MNMYIHAGAGAIEPKAAASEATKTSAPGNSKEVFVSVHACPRASVAPACMCIHVRAGVLTDTDA